MIDDSDSELVGDTVERILKLHGNQLDIYSIPKPHQIVLAVNQAHARISNGGFQFLLERKDADFDLCTLMPESHATIGAEQAHRAFSRFLRGTLWIRPTSAISRPLNRLRLPLSMIKALLGFETADTLYFESSDETFRLLAEYVRANTGALPTG
ncbi:MAG TPA: DUF4375 domain-containing protein [Rhodopirellula baltica]|uniref:DNA mimic protein DMP19 C-terminal domain-containing protein n=3 Tax=Rhodopirellula baltica TaxID=265606 RepID=Q7UZD0_RHOBA|nr:hypothetical protein RB40 [Rhodopirellula baltica SH 1]HBE65887.1 DUF4375 domain-containing protein [Rhodopirellula baltica]